MPTAVYIYSKRRLQEARGNLEDDLDDLLSGAGEVTGGGVGEMGWNIDVELEDTASVETWIHRLAEFLRGWGVPQDTLFEVISDGSEPRRVDVFDNRS
jgi:hypothetical protein